MMPSHEDICTSFGKSSSSPSQKNPPSFVDATFVKMVFFSIVFMALGLVLKDVPGGERERDEVRVVHVVYKERGSGECIGCREIKGVKGHMWYRMREYLWHKAMRVRNTHEIGWGM